VEENLALKGGSSGGDHAALLGGGEAGAAGPGGAGAGADRLAVRRILRQLGLKPARYWSWVERAARGVLADRPPRAPAVDAILPEEKRAVITYALVHPKDGYRRLTWQMVDADVAYLSPSCIGCWMTKICSTGGSEAARRGRRRLRLSAPLGDFHSNVEAAERAFDVPAERIPMAMESVEKHQIL